MKFRLVCFSLLAVLLCGCSQTVKLSNNSEPSPDHLFDTSESGPPATMSTAEGGSGVDSCVPESDAELCAQQEKDCDALTSIDRCGIARQIEDCGTCAEDKTCDSGQCIPKACVSESDPAFCQRLGLDQTCGQVSGVDNCGITRVVSKCTVCGNGTYCKQNRCDPFTSDEAIIIVQDTNQELENNTALTLYSNKGKIGVSQGAMGLPFLDVMVRQINCGFLSSNPALSIRMIASSIDSPTTELFSKTYPASRYDTACSVRALCCGGGNIFPDSYIATFPAIEYMFHAWPFKADEKRAMCQHINEPVLLSAEVLLTDGTVVGGRKPYLVVFRDPKDGCSTN